MLGLCRLILVKCLLFRMFADDLVSIITWTGNSATLIVILERFIEGIIV